MPAIVRVIGADTVKITSTTTRMINNNNKNNATLKISHHFEGPEAGLPKNKKSNSHKTTTKHTSKMEPQDSPFPFSSTISLSSNSDSDSDCSSSSSSSSLNHHHHHHQWELQEEEDSRQQLCHNSRFYAVFGMQDSPHAFSVLDLLSVVSFPALHKDKQDEKASRASLSAMTPISRTTTRLDSINHNKDAQKKSKKVNKKTHDSEKDRSRLQRPSKQCKLVVDTLLLPKPQAALPQTEQRSQQQNKVDRQLKTVTFDEDMNVYIPHDGNKCPKDLQELWYNKAELKSFKTGRKI